MATNLKLYGPFDIPCPNKGRSKSIDTEQKKQFSALLIKKKLAKKQGCYIFALRAGRGYTPWYVGKATKSLEQEIMTPHKLHHYNMVLARGKRGTPVMFVVAPEGNKNKVSKNICDEAEKVFIQAAIYKNPSLRNIQKTKKPEWGVNGVLRGAKGKPTKEAKSFKVMMGL